MVQACGDAHLANFGLYASPERKLVFDLNDFDETLQGPWEWDLKRLVTSVVIAARHNRLERDESLEAARVAVEGYRRAMHRFAKMRVMDIWYSLIDEADYLLFASQELTKRARSTISRAKRKHNRQALDRLTEEVDGKYRIRSEPPLLVPLRELGDKVGLRNRGLILESYEAYKKGVTPECRVLLENYRPVDFALKVVGVGSVGTRCWIMLLQGRDREDPLFLQMKEATQSVFSEHLGPSPYRNQGRRVIEGQRLMQTVSDLLLGWTRVPDAAHDYYWRQLRDWKGSVNVDQLDASALQGYAQLCAWTLARAHARSGDPVAIAAYLGSSRRFDDAVTEFAEKYADQNQRDYEQFVDQIRSGRLEVALDS
jgi:uncharacterized protein (DUF2252 family)